MLFDKFLQIFDLVFSFWRDEVRAAKRITATTGIGRQAVVTAANILMITESFLNNRITFSIISSIGSKGLNIP